ncbi:MAG TPA: carbamoyltransferase HypF [Nitrospira sp.]|nr:carbamoyltransferase HypF [Nitrospira sp.]
MSAERARIVVRGAVQGVGFRPFVYRLAGQLGLNGWVLNSTAGVFVEVEGEGGTVRQFLLRLERERPPRAIIQSLEFAILDPAGYQGFEIRYSDESGAKSVLILPDVATCADCLRETLDPHDRRYRYPFTNCTNCGPRFSIIEALPYDRPNTSMKKFPMCSQCDREYHDPSDRRFHAQPNACPHCGPQLEFWDAAGQVLAPGDQALMQATNLVRSGGILALKGLGGFQLIVDARDEAAVSRLRSRKHREEKPFALMAPSLDAIEGACIVSELEKRLLLSPESPIVLLQRRESARWLAASIAPGNPSLGMMLPCTPLHHLLVRELGFEIVATSGNLSDEPICTDEHEAVERLGGIADGFLVHDRPIVRHVDDSVVRVMRDRELVLRRARGYAPLPVHLKDPLPCVLAVGAHLKNSVALSVGTEVFVSQHIGDLGTNQAFQAFRRVSEDLLQLYAATPAAIACDLHPDYLSTKHARQLAAPTYPVQHHWAHVLSCMAENEVEPPALGVSWDGTGYGTDGTIWGGEFLLARGGSFERVARFRQFPLPGGEAAIRQPSRTALGVLFEIWGESAFGRRDVSSVRDFLHDEIRVIRQMLARGLNAPVTSSAGRLFDAVASLIGLRHRTSFEGQAAMELEFAVQPGINACYAFAVHDGSPLIVDWGSTIEAILGDVVSGRPAGEISAKFHNTLAEIVRAVALRVGEAKIVLTGGCFQNRHLTEACLQRLLDAGFRPYWHQRVPPNDGGISLGQVVAAAEALRPRVLENQLAAA